MADNVETKVQQPVEVILGTLSKSLNERLDQDREFVNTALEEMAKGCDTLVERNNAITTDVTSLTDMVKSLEANLSAALEALSAKTAELEKALNTISSEPVRKSIQAVDVIAPKHASAEAVATVTAQELINKALTEIKAAPEARRLELSRAVSFLECGVSPIDVKRDFNL